MVSRTIADAAVGVVDLEISNLRSVSNALTHLGADHELVKRPADLDGCTHLILPGVGSYHVAMQRLHATGLAGALRDFAGAGRPLLGLCLGMQLLAETGVEGAPVAGLGLLSGRVERLRTERVPHVGWNSVELRGRHPVTDGLRDHSDFYFVHSFQLIAADIDVLGVTDYGQPIVAAVAHNSVIGFQFHPEKSQRNGLALLERFCLWNGAC